MKISKKIMEKLKRNNAHITDYLDAYRRMENVDFAVMITGSWGSGKTEFVKSWMDSLAKGDNDEKPDYLSVSLNGVSSLNDVDSLLFRAAHPVLGGKSVRIAGKVMGAIASGIKLSAGGADAKVGLEFSASDLKGISFDKWIGDAPLLVFDDLERCCIDIESLMGYFDDLLKNGKKLVLICAEEEIKKRWKENAQNETGRTLPSYAEISSKVVGKRFAVEAEIEDLYGVLVAQAECSGTLGAFLRDQKRVFVNVFKAVGAHEGANRRIHNYRAFKHALRDLAYWFGKMPNNERKHAGFLLDFSRAFVLIDYALLSGALKIDDAFESSGDPDTETPFDKLMNAGGVVWNAWDASGRDIGVPVELLKRMIFNEPVTKDELKQGVCQSRHFAEALEFNEWQQLLNWNRLDDGQMKLLTNEVLDNLTKFKYVAAEEILHVFALLGEMSEYKTYAKTLEEILEDCKTYVAKVVADRKFKLPPYDNSRYRWIDDQGLGFQYSGAFDNKPYFTSAREIVLSAIQEVDAQNQKGEIAKMTLEFGNYPGRFYTALRDPTNRWSHEPIFDRIDAIAFYKAYCSLSNENKNNVGSILYGRANRGSLPKENDFWIRLIGLIEEDIKNCGDGVMLPSVFQKKILAEHLKKVVVSHA